MKTYQKVILYALGSSTLLAGGAALFISKTERGFRILLDAMYGRDFPGIPLIQPDALAAELAGANPPLLLDTRSPEEYGVSHLRNAQLINPEDFTIDDVDDIERDREVVLYCSVGYRSGIITRRMREMGFSNVKNLYGGIFLWYNQGRPIYDDDEQVENVHPYSRLWGQFITR